VSIDVANNQLCLGATVVVHCIAGSYITSFITI